MKKLLKRYSPNPDVVIGLVIHTKAIDTGKLAEKIRALGAAKSI
jgi:hypothetical protein